MEQGKLVARAFRALAPLCLAVTWTKGLPQQLADARPGAALPVSVWRHARAHAISHTLLL